jgi:hypothetical protein
VKVFRIRDSNGLYSTGGQSPSFTKAGKTWSNIGHVKSHLRQFVGSRNLEIYADAEIVCVEYTEKDVEKFDILDFLSDLNKQDREDYEKSSYKTTWREEGLDNVRNEIAYLKQKRKENETK